jgi:hypothetical protein
VRDIRERDIGERDVLERDIREMDIGETVTTWRFAKLLLLHIDIRDVSGCLRVSQSRHCCAKFLWSHKPQKLGPTEGMILWSSWSWAMLRVLWSWGRLRRLWLWGMLMHLLAWLR